MCSVAFQLMTNPTSVIIAFFCLNAQLYKQILLEILVIRLKTSTLLEASVYFKGL